MTHHWVDRESELETWMARAREEDAVALDTEFVWERTYFPRLGLVQLGLGDGTCVLIDMPALEDLSSLAGLLEDASVVKMLHDAQQDLMIMRWACGGMPTRIFDTRLAAGLVGWKSTLSLSDLLGETLGLTMDKGETRSNWLRRPLTDSQLAYAAADVRHMHEVRACLLGRAEEMGRVAWLEEEMQRFEDASLYEDKDPDVQFERIKGRNRCSPEEAAILRALAAWREREARQLDLPKTFIAPDGLLLEITRKQPQSPQAIERLAERPKQVRRYCQGLFDALQEGLKAAPIERSDRPDSPAFYRALDKQVSEEMERLRELAEQAKVDPVLLATRAGLKEFLGDRNPQPENHALLRGWRREVAGATLLARRV